MRRFEQECERLRPLGKAYVHAPFRRLARPADAEDAVAEVIIRLHRQAAAGRAPANLRAAFLPASVTLRSISCETGRCVRRSSWRRWAETLVEGPSPEQRAEPREDSMRLQEAMGRMRSNYREAIMLRFGLGLTVPEIAERLGISLPAAKKLVLRSTAQARKRLEAIDGAEFCSEMRDFAERALIDEEVNDVCDEDRGPERRTSSTAAAAVRFVTSLRRGVHDFGSGLVLAGLASSTPGPPCESVRGSTICGRAARSSSRRPGCSPTRRAAPAAGKRRGRGAFAGATQKIAAVCTAGAASAATCVATGLVGPGLGVAIAPPVIHHERHRRSVEQVRKAPKPVHHPAISYTAPGGRSRREPKGKRRPRWHRNLAALPPKRPAPRRKRRQCPSNRPKPNRSRKPRAERAVGIRLRGRSLGAARTHGRSRSAGPGHPVPADRS